MPSMTVAGTTVTNISKNFESSPLFGLGIGYRHNDHLRFDLTGEFRGNATFHGLDVYTTPPARPDGTDEYTAVKTEWTFLANAYWDIGTWHSVTPFVGGGIGASLNTIKGFTDVNTVTKRRRLWRRPLPVEPRLAAHRRPGLPGHAQPDDRGGLPLHRSGQCSVRRSHRL